MRYLQKVEDE